MTRLHILLYVSLIAILSLTAFSSYLTHRILKEEVDAKVIKTEHAEEIKRHVSRIPSALGVTVISADIQTNTRKLVYYHMMDKELERMFADYIRYRRITQEEPLFLRKDGEEINERMIKLINHQFVCAPFTETLNSRFVPEAGTKIKVACAVGIPPSFGTFNGVVTVFLSKWPTDEERLYIVTTLRDLANKISPEITKKSGR